MWIQTQNKQQIINSDQVIDIFISVRGNVIYAETIKENYTALGEYGYRNICLKVLEHIFIAMNNNLPGIPMPLGGEVDTWAEGIDKIAAIDIANDFIKSL